MTADKTVIDHYNRADLGNTILAALNAAGKNLNQLTPEDLSPVDEFHIGGRVATAHLMSYLQFHAEMHILDVGSGLGGASRYVAQATRARLTGIDLTPEYCRTAALLSLKTGLNEHTLYREGNALSMPFPNNEFTGAYSIHTAMNIADKAALYREVARTLAPESLFGIYDVLEGSNSALPDYPLPWADTASASHLATIEGMRRTLGEAGFEILVEDDLSGQSLLQLKKLQKINPVPGPALVMGETWPQKIDNLIKAIAEKKCAPWVIICRKRKVWEDK
jgi:SAM-dependent methyltransferase